MWFTTQSAKAGSSHPSTGDFVPLTTLVLWTGSLLTGMMGLALPYARPQPPLPEPPPIQAAKIEVELTRDSASPPDVNQPTDASTSSLAVPEVAPPVAVAAPSPALAFALPVTGPVRLVAPAQAASASPHRPRNSSTTGAAPVQTLAYGREEGRQPAPDYPSTALRQGQEGVVNVRFNVGENGRVFAAVIAASSPWPLLDEAALRVVCERWRFAPGTIRTYEVAIQFLIKK